MGPDPLTTGSSPLTRGKRPWHTHGHRRRRLIPAHAGKTLTGMVADTDAGAHPRSRGENTRPASIDGWSMGSSPLTRGKPPLSRVYWSMDWLIPAHAGKTGC